MGKSSKETFRAINYRILRLHEKKNSQKTVIGLTKGPVRINPGTWRISRVKDQMALMGSTRAKKNSRAIAQESDFTGGPVRIIPSSLGHALSHNATSILLCRLLFVFYFVPIQAELDRHYVKNKSPSFQTDLSHLSRSRADSFLIPCSMLRTNKFHS